MWGKLSRLRTLFFEANPETIHTRGSSLYGVLELEESRFTPTFAMAEARAEETREFETDGSLRGYHVYWMSVIGEQMFVS